MNTEEHLAGITDNCFCVTWINDALYCSLCTNQTLYLLIKIFDHAFGQKIPYFALYKAVCEQADVKIIADTIIYESFL